MNDERGMMNAEGSSGPRRAQFIIHHSSFILQKGATLVELVISIVLISISVAAVIGVMGGMIGHSADPMIQHQAVAIAESYLEEITLKPFHDPGDGVTVCPANEGANRGQYDNICDYDGLNDTGAKDQSGTAIAGLENYTVSVTVDQAANLNGLSGSANILRIDVHVVYTDASVADVTLSGYRTNY